MDASKAVEPFQRVTRILTMELLPPNLPFGGRVAFRATLEAAKASKGNDAEGRNFALL